MDHDAATDLAEKAVDSRTYTPPPFNLMEDVKAILSEWKKLQVMHASSSNDTSVRRTR